MRCEKKKRELPGLGVPALVRGIAARFGLPLTESKLAGITVGDLREILAGDHADENCVVGVPDATLKDVARLLWGEGVSGSELPRLDAYGEGDMPGSIRVACASNNGEEIDGHFGSCERFLVYQLAPAEMRLIAVRPTLEADHAEDRNLARASLIGDCQVVYLQSIGGPAAAKVVRAGVHPVKLRQKGGADKATALQGGRAKDALLAVADGGTASLAAREVLAQLQRTLARPPPWLAKVMGVEAASLAPYRELAEAEEE